MGAFKVDWALDAPIPWLDDRRAHRAGTVHLGGTLSEIAASERDAWSGRVAERPFVLLASRRCSIRPGRPPADTSRGPTATCRMRRRWTCCRASRRRSSGSRPGSASASWRGTSRRRPISNAATRTWSAATSVWGRWTGASSSPVRRGGPTRRPHARSYLCSASTPPGVGVHGMCGYFAAQAALRTALA